MNRLEKERLMACVSFKTRDRIDPYKPGF